MIEGLNIRCNVGPVEILRSPFLELVFRRCAVLSRATVVVPDPEGEVRSRLAVGQAVAVRWGYRGEAGMWQEWEGTVEGIDQPRRDADGADAVVVRAVGLEKALTTTMVTESFYREPADVVARRAKCGHGLPWARWMCRATCCRTRSFPGYPWRGPCASWPIRWNAASAMT